MPFRIDLAPWIWIRNDLDFLYPVPDQYREHGSGSMRAKFTLQK